MKAMTRQTAGLDMGVTKEAAAMTRGTTKGGIADLLSERESASDTSQRYNNKRTGIDSRSDRSYGHSMKAVVPAPKGNNYMTEKPRDSKPFYE